MGAENLNASFKANYICFVLLLCLQVAKVTWHHTKQQTVSINYLHFLHRAGAWVGRVVLFQKSEDTDNLKHEEI